MTATVTDRIEKKTILRAPRARVWRAIATPAEFGAWFGVDLSAVQSFAPGTSITGPITIPEYRHLTFNATVEQVVPERLLSFRWHPHPVPPEKDFSSEPTTLVTFEVSDAPEGTLLTIVESGFDGIPLERRAEAFRGNEGGWTAQIGNIARHLERG
jgi:uncharacterized protein YndB with AHSA1/START domain